MKLEDELAYQLDVSGIAYEREYKAIPGRRYRYDFKIGNLLIEVQGGVYQYKPSHASAAGIRRDCEKVDLAVANGYKILLFTSDMITSGWALRMIEEVMNG